MLLLRDVQPIDLEGLSRLAAVLNSVNLPNDEAVLAKLIDRSVQSFTGRLANPLEREYVFVLENLRTGELVGTSMVIAQHGTWDAPHIYLQVTEAESYSQTIDQHFRHTVLSIRYNYEGPTEIGGLVVSPGERSGPGKPGKQLSYVRFLFMAMYPERFRPRVIAELLPPLLPDGRSLLWESFGKKFTGLEYMEADQLSRRNKEFIKELFPPVDVYATLFPARAQRVIGEVHPETRGVQRMLERIGFTYVHHIDPFDGGPHYEANLSDVSLVRAFRRARLLKTALDESGEGDGRTDVIVGRSRSSGRSRFHAIRCQARLEPQGLRLSREARDALQARSGEVLSVIPFE